MSICKYICNGKKRVSGNSGKDLRAASHQIEVFHLNWQQNECHHDME